MLHGAFSIAPSAIVCDDCEIVGDVFIDAKTVIHPCARILALGGPIRIGKGNIIEERVEIINSTQNTVLEIGPYNVFEVGAKVECKGVGRQNIFEIKSYVGPQVRVSNGCIIGAGCSLTDAETLPENIVIFGDKLQRRIAPSRPPRQYLQLDFFVKHLPRYHYIFLPTMPITDSLNTSLDSNLETSHNEETSSPRLSYRP